MNFYESKKNYIFLLMLCGAVFLFFAGLTVYTYSEGSYFLMTVCLSLTLLMIWVTFKNAQKLTGDNPYVTTGKDYLTLYVTPNEKVDIQWTDIIDYVFYEIQGNKFIGLVLQDEEKYAHEMSDSMRRMTRLNMKMGYPMLNITFLFGKNSLHSVYKKISALIRSTLSISSRLQILNITFISHLFSVHNPSVQ